MKKFLGYILVLALFFITPIALVGCKAELENIKVDKSTIKQTYVVGEQVEDFKQNAKVYAVYSDKTEKLVDNSEVEFSIISTTIIGDQTLTITYKDKECKVKITVYNKIEDSYEIVGFETPSFVNTYNKNKEEKINKETEFFDKEQMYTVGSDNGFVFLPNITALNEQGTAITLNAYKSIAKIYLKGDGDSYTELTGENKVNMVSYNDETSTFNFTENAIGKQFKIEVVPYYYQELDSVSFELKVEKGYNVYDADGLAVIDNATTEEESRINWSVKREETGIGEITTSAVFIHNNLVVENNNLPTYLFHTESDDDSKALLSGGYPNIMGSLRDYSSLYKRVLKDNEKFSINGNYFTIDVQKVSKIQKFDGDAQKDQISHAQIFRAVGKDVNSKDTSKFEIKNVSIIGNAEHAEDTQNAGGLIFVKMNNCQASAKNIITRFNVIDWFSEISASFAVDSVKSYDSYSSMIYTFKKSSISITNSEMKRCGGPLAIIDHSNSKEDTDLYNDMVVENSVLENFVTGQEAWFNNMGVTSLAANLRAMNGLITGYSNNTKTFMNSSNAFNCLYALYDGSDVFTTEGKTKCTLNLNGFTMDLTGQDKIMATLRENAKANPVIPAIFQTKSKYMIMTGTTTLGTFNPASGIAQTVPDDFQDSGDYLGVVLNASICVVLGLYDVA